MLRGLRLKSRRAGLEILEARKLLATVSGFAFIDADSDGQRSSNELGLPGVFVELQDESGETLQSGVTSDLGFYAFTDLQAGIYSVRAHQPEAVTDGLESSAFPGVTVGDDEIANIVLEDQDIATELNFGESGIKPAYISALWVFSSTIASDHGALLREVVAGAELVSGNVALSTRIRQEAEAGAVATPVSTTDRYFTVAGGELLVSVAEGVLNNDLSPSGAELSAGLLRPPEHGALVLNLDGSFSYVSNADFEGEDSFVYEAVAGGISSTTTVRIDVAPPPNRTPISQEDKYRLREDETLEVEAPGVLANDADVDGDELRAFVTRQPADGILSFTEDGAFAYTPNENFFGTDSFTYTARDEVSVSDETLVQLEIDAVNDVPEGIGDAFVVSEDETLTITAAEGVLANDSDVDSDELEAILADDAAHGVVTLEADGSFAYRPNLGFSGLDSFTYVASDGTDASPPITVTIDVGSVNDAPVANADEFSTSEDTTLSVNVGVLANDEDSDGDALTAELREGPANGTLTLNVDGTFEYIPNSDFHGADSFTYVANDGLRLSNPATVTLTVASVNDAPVAVGDQYGISQGESLTVDASSGVLANDTDAEFDELTAVVVEGPSNGQIVLASNGAFVYTPAQEFSGVDAFSYRANDGLDDSDTVTVIIAVSTANSAPQSSDDAYDVDENTRLEIDAVNGVLANDTDDDGDQLTAQLISQPENGSVTLNTDGSFSYTPSSGFRGSDSFRYEATDGIDTSDSTTVNITVIPAPVTIADSVTIGASKDNSLFESSEGSLSNGSGQYLFVGKTLQAENSLRRALLAFDFSSIPANATITNVSLTLNMSRTIVDAFDVTLHRVTRDWGEGTSDAAAEEGRGAESASGDATWIHALFDSETWSTPGGDFDAAVSALTSVAGDGSYTWASPQMAADVQAWIDNSESNAGWILLTDENEVSAKRFDSHENPTEANRPQLVVEYEFTPIAQGAQVPATRDGASAPSVDAHDAAFAEAGERLLGDGNLDGDVNFQDFLRLAANFGRTDAAFADGDFDENGAVDFSDFLVLAESFGARLN